MQLLTAQLNCKFSIQVGQTIALPIALKQPSALAHKWHRTSQAVKSTSNHAYKQRSLALQYLRKRKRDHVLVRCFMQSA
jgi:hypothetical protein